jgi:hypothetical protein
MNMENSKLNTHRVAQRQPVSNITIITILLSLILFNCVNNKSHAQTPAIEWQKCLGGTEGDAANSIQQTSDGGFIVAGYTESNDGDVSGNHGYDDFWVVKLNSSGTIQWQNALAEYMLIMQTQSSRQVMGDILWLVKHGPMTVMCRRIMEVVTLG